MDNEKREYETEKEEEQAKEIKRLKEALKEIENIAENTPEDAEPSEYNDVIDLILSLAKQA